LAVAELASRLARGDTAGLDAIAPGIIAVTMMRLRTVARSTQLMSTLKLAPLALLTTLLVACAAVEVDTWDTQGFAAGNFQTYSWRSEPFSREVYFRDPIYVIDPILRDLVDAELQDLGYRQVPRGGDFTVDYIYAPGVRLGAPSSAASNVAPRAGVRPNTSISQAERDNAIALAGVKETRNIAIQLNNGHTGSEVWRAVITKIVANVNEVDAKSARSSLGKGVRRAFSDFPKAN